MLKHTHRQNMKNTDKHVTFSLKLNWTRSVLRLILFWTRSCRADIYSGDDRKLSSGGPFFNPFLLPFWNVSPALRVVTVYQCWQQRFYPSTTSLHLLRSYLFPFPPPCFFFSKAQTNGSLSKGVLGNVGGMCSSTLPALASAQHHGGRTHY